jgi:glycosyltransferase involved in cell wall biosynthesis
MPEISICIPTFNQPIAIEQLLERLVNQYNYEIEIIICE